MIVNFAMTLEDLQILLDLPELPAILEQTLRIPANRRVSELKKILPNLPTAVLATWTTNMEKALTKLPTFAHHQCLMPTLSLEQASPEVVAEVMPYPCGNMAVDLTGGLGVDSYFMARRYKQVIYIEADADLCKLAEYNFKRLGADNITILHTTAEKWLTENESFVDLIYADPARRDQRHARISDPDQCFPKVSPLLSLIRRGTHHFLVKTSPLFDFRQGLYRWKEVSAIHFYSVNGEMKEIIYAFDFINQSNNCALFLNAYLKGQWFQYQYLTD
jgi:hypothetical protein